jgi:hypothetical protein
VVHRLARTPTVQDPAVHRKQRAFPGRSVDRVVARRNKLVGKIDAKMLFATAQRSGQIYAPKPLKTFLDNLTGERKTVEATTRIKEWYRTNSTAKSISLYAMETSHWNWLKAAH